MSAQTFRYGQILWALWQLFRQPSTKNTIPPVFKARIIRLLATDRKRKKKYRAEHYAFLDHGPVGKGGEIEYTLENVFCLAFGLALMDVGLNQVEVVDYVQGHKLGILRAYREALNDRDMAWVEKAGKPAAEKSDRTFPTFYALVYIAKLSEAHGTKAKRSEPGLSWDPHFSSHKRLQLPATYSLDMETRLSREMRPIVIEIGRMTYLIERLLTEAPVRRRGRP